MGAMISEDEHGESKSDFRHKLAIVQKEINDTKYWLELMIDIDYLSKTEFKSIHKDAIELLKLITAILRTSKSNLQLTTNH